MTEKQDLKFYVEYPPENLKVTGLSRPEYLRQNVLTKEVCGALAERHWGIAIATTDFSEGTANLIQWMNKNYSDIPIVTWLVLPHEQGYWTNEENLKETDIRLGELIQWIDKNKLDIKGIGFDIEVPVQWSAKALEKGRGGYILAGLKRGLQKRWERLYQSDKRGEKPAQEFAYIVGKAKGQGIPTEAYKLPRPLSDILGLFEPENVDRVFTMVYTNEIPGQLARPLLELNIRKGIYPAFGVTAPETEALPWKVILPSKDTKKKTPPVLDEQGLSRAVEIVRRKGEKDEIDYLQAVRVFCLTGKKTVNWVASVLQPS